MKTRTIIEQPLMTLWYSDYNTAPISRKVFPRDLAAAAVGTVFEPDADTACGRARDAESLTVVYRDQHGVACLHRRWGTEDTPAAEPWAADPELIWFEINT